MSADVVYRKNPDVVARGLAEGEGGVLLRLDSGAYFGVNPVGLLVWELRYVSISLAYPGLKPSSPSSSPASTNP